MRDSKKMKRKKRTEKPRTNRVKASMKRRLTCVLITYLLMSASFGNILVLAQEAKQEQPAPATTTPNTASPTALDKVETQANTEIVPEADLVKLQDLIEQALQNNPEVKAMQRSFDMMRARVPQAKALPDPMLNIGYTGNITPIPPFDLQKNDPASGRMIGISQELPFPGKRSLRGKVASVTLP